MDIDVRNDDIDGGIRSVGCVERSNDDAEQTE